MLPLDNQAAHTPFSFSFSFLFFLLLMSLSILLHLIYGQAFKRVPMAGNGVLGDGYGKLKLIKKN